MESRGRGVRASLVRRVAEGGACGLVFWFSVFSYVPTCLYDRGRAGGGADRHPLVLGAERPMRWVVLGLHVKDYVLVIVVA